MARTEARNRAWLPDAILRSGLRVLFAALLAVTCGLLPGAKAPHGISLERLNSASAASHSDPDTPFDHHGETLDHHEVGREAPASESAFFDLPRNWFAQPTMLRVARKGDGFERPPRA
ncbi:hypothetical protein [Dongia sp.]|uniref:hypothetical protein n=1 Tax=Dongia sp. TaxID=1977262 RepID=UPI003751AEBC